MMEDDEEEENRRVASPSPPSEMPISAHCRWATVCRAWRDTISSTRTGQSGRRGTRPKRRVTSTAATRGYDLGLVTFPRLTISTGKMRSAYFAVEERASFSPDALTGMEANAALCGSGNHGDQDIRPPDCLAELDLPAAQRGRRPNGALQRYCTAMRQNTDMRLVTMCKELCIKCSRLSHERRLRYAAFQTMSSLSPTSDCSARLRAWQPRLHRTGGTRSDPHGFQESDVYLANGDQRRTRRLGAFRLRQDAGLSLGASSSAPPKSRTARSVVANMPGIQPGRKYLANTAALLRRLIVIQGDTEPASVEQQRHPRQDLRRRFTTCATCSRSMSRRAVISGRWSICCRQPISALTAAKKPRRLLRTIQSGNPVEAPRMLGAFNEADARLAVVLHVHLFHRPRRQVPARLACRIRVRSAVALMPLQ